MSDVIEEARGRWFEILTHFGVDGKLLRKKHGPCPVCGGKDRFLFDNKDNRGTFYCNQCGAGVGFTLLCRLRGWNMKEAIKEVGKVVGSFERKIERMEEKSDDEKRKAMNDVWKAGHSPQMGGAVQTYLSERTGIVEPPKCVLEHSSLRHPEAPNGMIGMIAKVTSLDGKPVSIHRTFLTPDGKKADVKPQKMLMAGHIPDGAAIRLFPFGDTLGITEGIETAMSCYKLFGIPTWAAISSTMLVKWTPPELVKNVIIFGDNDHNFTGQLAAYRLANQLLKDNNSKYNINVAIPYINGADWNDVLTIEGSELARENSKHAHPWLPNNI